MLGTLGPIVRVSREQADAAPLPHWKQIAREPEEEVARLDPAFVQFVTNMGFPGSERLNHNGCLRTLRGWIPRIKQYTNQNLPHFRRNPSLFENSEAYFRALCRACDERRHHPNPYEVIGSGLPPDVLVAGRLALQSVVEQFMRDFGDRVYGRHPYTPLARSALTLPSRTSRATRSRSRASGGP